MTGLSWTEVAKKPIVSFFVDNIRGLQLALSSEEVDDEAQVVDFEKRIPLLQAEVDRRLKDERYTIRVKHIGSVEDDLVALLKAEDSAVEFEAEVRARKAIAEQLGGGEVDEARVRAAVRRDPAFIKAQRAQHLKWLREGLADGDTAINALFAHGGHQLLEQAAYEVRRWQSLGWDEGEG